MTGPIKAGSVPDIGLYGYPRVVALGCSDAQHAAMLHRAIVTGHRSVSEWAVAVLRRELDRALDE